MSNPYSHFSEDDQAGFSESEVERTSASAIAALILSLTCCLSPVGLITGIGSLISINASGGRVKGKGLAIAAIIIGLVFSVILGAAVATFATGARASMTQVRAAGEAMADIEAGDFDAARQGLAPPVADASDSAFEEFRAAYRDEAGSFVSVPGGFMDYIRAMAELGQQMQGYQQTGPVIPVPGMFDQGRRLIKSVYPQDPGQRQPSGGGIPALPIKDLVVREADGAEIRLSDFMTGADQETEQSADGPAGGEATESSGEQERGGETDAPGESTEEEGGGP